MFLPLPDGLRGHRIRKAAEDEWNQTNTCAHVEVTPDGRFLYGSNRGHDSLVSFAVGADGLLKTLSWTSTKGHHPRNFSIHPSGRWVVVLNADSDNCVVFKIDAKTCACNSVTVHCRLAKPLRQLSALASAFLHIFEKLLDRY